MELSRRSLLRFGAATGAGLMLPRFLGGKRGHHTMGSLLADPATIYTYEEGVDGTPVLPGNGVVAVLGSPFYSAADATHGAMGWVSAAPALGGRLIYANPSVPQSSGSVYLTPHLVSSGVTATVVGFCGDPSGISPAASLRLTSDGRVDIADAAGARHAVSRVCWAPPQHVRLDWQQSWDGTTLGLTVWVYAGTNAEGWRPDAILQTAFAAGSPTYVTLGQENNSKVSVGFDTYRDYSSATVPAPYAPIMGAAALHSYDEGVNGKVVLAGVNMVTGVTGTPKYATVATMHGTMGVILPATGTGILKYDNPYPPAHTGSLYVRAVTRGGSDSRIVTIQNGSVVLAQVKISKTGALYIADPAGTLLSVTPVKAKLNRWTRVDWQATWDGVSLAVTARYFSTDAESPDNFTLIAASLPTTATPDTLAIGSASASWKIYLDTLRTYGDIAAWPAPFAPNTPPRAPGMAAWSGDATQSTVEISAYTNGTTSVGLAVSPNSDMSGATPWPATPPNIAGWNKWSVTGLAAGTQYYHQFNDTPSGGESAPIGIISTFKTLQPVGIGCVTRLAVGSCGQNNPTTTSAFDDIVVWAPDRSVHLGDFSYPNNLTTDLSTHMNNWSLNATDVGISRILAIGCMDYVISDHDVNGTGNSNLPNFNDPVTMASLVAWQQVVPARIEDTEDPKHGRWRADIEGNVRFIKLDTRSIDKTDTTTTSTDPRSPNSTMLGVTQLGWLKAQIDAAVAAHQLIILFSDCAWNGVSPGPPIAVTYSDKWPSYIYERDLISDYAFAAGAQMFIVFGDSHGLQQDDGTNEKNGFASICCGPFDQELHMHYQESYQWSYPAGILDQGGPYRHAQQYHRLTISQDVGSSTITVVADARDCSPVVEGTPLTASTMTKVYTV